MPRFLSYVDARFLILDLCVPNYGVPIRSQETTQELWWKPANGLGHRWDEEGKGNTGNEGAKGGMGDGRAEKRRPGREGCLTPQTFENSPYFLRQGALLGHGAHQLVCRQCPTFTGVLRIQTHVLILCGKYFTHLDRYSPY